MDTNCSKYYSRTGWHQWCGFYFQFKKPSASAKSQEPSQQQEVGQRTWMMQEWGTCVFLVSPHSHGQCVRSVPDSFWEATLVAEMPREFEELWIDHITMQCPETPIQPGRGWGQNVPLAAPEHTPRTPKGSQTQDSAWSYRWGATRAAWAEVVLEQPNSQQGEWPQGEPWAGAASTKWEQGAEPSRLTAPARASTGTGQLGSTLTPLRISMGNALKLALLEQEPPRAQAARAGTQLQAPLLSSHTAAFFWEVTVPTFCCLNPDSSPISHPCVLCLPPSQRQRSCCPALQLSGRTHQSPPQGEKAKALHIHQFGWFKRKAICF